MLQYYSLFSSFRASSKHGSDGAATSLVHAFNLIKDVQKTFKTREQEKKELEVRGRRRREREGGKGGERKGGREGEGGG
jgi:hypothetical protein